MKLRRLLAAILAGSFLIQPIVAEEPDLKSIRFDQHLDRRLTTTTPFTDENGDSVTLASYLGQQKPVVLVPGYYRCPMLCGAISNGLIASLQELRLNLGKDFTVIHFSIDPKEGPAEATARKQTFLRRYSRPGAAEGWHFLTSAESSSRQLAQEIGFGYGYDQPTQQYAHPSGLVLLTPDGRIARYFFGVNFDPKALRLALVEASQNRIGSPIDQLLLLCFHYNPLTGKYSFAILHLLRACGALTVLVIAGYIIFSARRTRARSNNRGEAAA